MKEMVTLNKKEQSRLIVLNGVEIGRVTVREAAAVLGLSLRRVRRILAAYRKEGAAALAHGNRGRKPHNALGDGLRRRVLELAQSTYAGCNNQHFTELLAEREGTATLARVWEIFDYPCGQRLKHILEAELERLIGLGELKVSDDVALNMTASRS